MRKSPSVVTSQPSPVRKRASGQIPTLAITSLVAAGFLSACSAKEDSASGSWTAQTDTKLCTDANGVRVDDDHCERPRQASSSAGAAFFAWYYLSRGNHVPAYGLKPTGGSYEPVAGRQYASSKAIARGGFGRTGARASARSFGS